MNKQIKKIMNNESDKMERSHCKMVVIKGHWVKVSVGNIWLQNKLYVSEDDKSGKLTCIELHDSNITLLEIMNNNYKLVYIMPL